jgi:hypothetical protein
MEGGVEDGKREEGKRGRGEEGKNGKREDVPAEFAIQEDHLVQGIRSCIFLEKLRFYCLPYDQRINFKTEIAFHNWNLDQG